MEKFNLYLDTLGSALPLHPYAPWRVDCSTTQNQTLTYQNDTFRAISRYDAWSAELQNGKNLQSSSIRCWCKSDVQHEWDSEALGPGNGWWTFTKHLTDKGDSCVCPTGQAIMVELDHNTCTGFEEASGFFHSSTSSTSAGSEVAPELLGLSLLCAFSLLSNF